MDPLPIDEALPALLSALRDHPAVVLQAPPGAGKTTRVPLALLQAGLLGQGKLVMLEPRRVAARAAARTLARNLGEEPGRTVGHQVRYETVASKDTRIMVVTEGILGRRLLSDPTLEGITCVVIDELHERSIHTDLALAFLKELLEVRDDLKLVCMSATLDAGAVSRFLHDAPIITSAGRPFPVAIAHADKDDRFLEERMVGAIRKLMVADDDDGGDVLCFLPGAPEIRRTAERLSERPLPLWRGEPVDVVQLYGALPAHQQDRAIQRGPRRRVVLSTNVAETSLTLEGVSTVVDSGLVKLARHDPATDRAHLDTVRISLSSAEQRAGRAGRLRPGRCVRLWTMTEHHTLEPSHAPEIARADLAPVLLEVLSFHPGNPRAFPFFQAPPPRALDRAIEQLRMLGAIDDNARLTPLGRDLSSLPVHPRTGTMLLAGGAGGDVDELCLAAALLEDDRTWPRERARTTTDSDLATAMDAFDEHRQQETARARNDVRRLVHKLRCGDAPLKECLLRAFPDRLCRRRRPGAPEALMVGGRGVALAHESGVLDAELFLALALAGDGAAARVRIAEAVSLADIERALPHLIVKRDEAVFDQERGALAGVRRTRLATPGGGGLIIEEKAGIAVSPEAAARALADVIGADLARHLRLDDTARQVRDRLAFAALHLRTDALPTGSDDELRALLPEVCQGKRTIAEVQRTPWAQALLGALSWPQRQLLDLEVPARLEVPTGSMIAVDYAPALAGGAPVLAVRLQELFGLLDTPRVARGRVAVVLHLLSPGYQPVQVTTDLASFWRSTYGEVKRELRARYPKHSWPDDPLTATPQAKGRPRR